MELERDSPHSPTNLLNIKNNLLFDSLDIEGKGYISKSNLIQEIKNTGIKLTDYRLENNFKILNSFKEDKLNKDQFIKFISENNGLLIDILSNKLIIPKWKNFKEEINNIYDKIKNNINGNVADYIPQLAKVDSKLLGISITTIDGQIYSKGDTDYHLCVQSCSKPISYCIAVEENGEDVVHNHIGREPSGKNFNELCLNSDKLPHNPLINSGAIMAVSLIQYQEKQADRFDHIIEYWSRLAGNTKVNFSNSVYLSEKDSADRNFCLGYMMQENKAFSTGKNEKYKREWNLSDLIKNLELYFQCCSIELTCEQASVVAASLANGGICPTTNDKVFKSKNVKNVLSLMSSCGMYDYSGEWAYTIGIPAKSGVSGLIMAVIPNVMGIAVFSPKLDSIGNSVRGIEFFKEFTDIFGFHIYDNILDSSKKQITLNNVDKTDIHNYLLFNAASNGDLLEIKKLYSSGINLNISDYDKRTALHLAASENKIKIVKFLLNKNVDKNVVDRWGNTPLDDAIRGDCKEIIELLKK